MSTQDVEKTIKGLEERVANAEEAARKAEEDKAAILAGGASLRTKGMANSDEQQALRYFGARDVKDLLSVNTGAERFKGVPDNLKQLVRNLKEDFDLSRMMQQMFNGEALDKGDKEAHVKGVLDGNYHARHVLAPKLKAFGTDVAGGGQEWVPTIISSQYIEEYELDREVVDQFKSINMPSSPYEVPVQSDPTRARRQPESCDPADNLAPANFSTGSIVMDAEKHVEYMCLPEELHEDSAPDILRLVREEVTKAQLRAWEYAILNGDDSVTHMDSDITAATDSAKSWKGLRKLALDNSATKDFGGGALTTSNLRDMRTLMGKFGVKERELVWVVSPRAYQQMLNLPEVTSVEKFGPMATILRGALAALDGIAIVISQDARDDLNATGVYDGVTTNLSCVQLVNRTRFYFGNRRPIRVRATMDPTPPGDRWLLASWWRGDFQGHAQSASETSAVLGVNVG